MSVSAMRYAVLLALFMVCTGCATALDTLGLHFVADTIQRSVNSVADAIPGILAALGVMGVAALIAYLIRPPVTRLLAGTGIDRWGQQIGLSPPPAVMAATAQYRGDSDALGDFFSERCVLETAARVSRAALRNAYEMWCATAP